MTHTEAVALIQNGNIQAGQTWADVGAGSGRFTYALAELLGPEGQVYALDLQPSLEAGPVSEKLAKVESRQVDFREGISLSGLDGLLMANSLHYAPSAADALRKLLPSLKTGGLLIVVEYDTNQGNPWVPYPISRADFDSLAAKVGLHSVQELGRHPSRYGHNGMYAVQAVLKSL